MENIKVVIRKYLPETNSSSSHSVVIATGSVGQVDKYVTPGSPYWDLPMDKEGYIHIPSRSFGREWDKFNTVLSKVQYVCGLIIGTSMTEADSHPRLKELADILVSFSGAKGVIFDWLPAYYNHIQEIGDDIEELKYWESPDGCEIDHQSMDLADDILESTQTIKDFIFDPKSLLFLGSDESDPTDDFYSDEEPEAILSVDLGGSIGRVDYPLETYPCNIETALSSSDGWGRPGIFDSLVYSDGSFRPKTAADDDEKPEDDSSIIMYYQGVAREFYGIRPFSANPHIQSLYWSAEELNDAVMKELTAKIEAGDQHPNEEEITRSIMQKHPEWYIEVPYTIVTKEFGKV